MKLISAVIKPFKLDDVRGIGPKRRSALLKHFGSIEAIRAASVEELAAVPSMIGRPSKMAIKKLSV